MGRRVLAVHRRRHLCPGTAQPRSVDGHRSWWAGDDLLTGHRGRHPPSRRSDSMIGPFALAVLDMAGTTVRDDGAVDEAFTVALTAAGVAPDSEQFAQARQYVLDTMGQSKSDVFAALLDPEPASKATKDFADAYEAIVA